ncbi:MAG: molybdopterin converting factor subunit 1 [Burkholderiaceae bacterium]|jgi:molybdopterin synthase sulfur carrier subunit
MKITVKYFAGLRESVERAGETLDVPAGATVGTLLDRLRQRGGTFALVFASSQTVHSAVNFTLVSADFELHDGDEVAFFPPVTGG